MLVAGSAQLHANDSSKTELGLASRQATQHLEASHVTHTTPIGESLAEIAGIAETPPRRAYA